MILGLLKKIPITGCLEAKNSLTTRIIPKSLLSC